MEVTWKILLDDIKLPDEIRKVADLIILEDLPLGFPKNSQMTEIANYIKKFLKGKEVLTVTKPSRIAMDSSGSPKLEHYNETIALDSINRLRDIWIREAGAYILILPDQFIPDEVDFQFDDEEMIGRILIKVRRLLLKTPDGDKLLYLYINDL